MMPYRLRANVDEHDLAYTTLRKEKVARRRKIPR